MFITKIKLKNMPCYSSFWDSHSSSLYEEKESRKWRRRKLENPKLHINKASESTLHIIKYGVSPKQYTYKKNKNIWIFILILLKLGILFFFFFISLQLMSNRLGHIGLMGWPTSNICSVRLTRTNASRGCLIRFKNGLNMCWALIHRHPSSF